MRFFKSIVIHSALAISLSAVEAKVIFVEASAAGTADGASWASAFTNLDAALGAADAGDEVWVAAGVYRPEILAPSEGATRTATFTVPSGVSVIGGFSGFETSADERDPEGNKSVISGDLAADDVDGDGDGIAQTADDHVGDNAFSVFTASAGSLPTTFDTLHITAGVADIFDSTAGSYGKRGGGGYLPIAST